MMEALPADLLRYTAAMLLFDGDVLSVASLAGASSALHKELNPLLKALKALLRKPSVAPRVSTSSPWIDSVMSLMKDRPWLVTVIRPFFIMGLFANELAARSWARIDSILGFEGVHFLEGVDFGYNADMDESIR